MHTSISKLLHYIETNHYAGHDPYDALKSPLFKLPLLKSNKLIRFGSQQLVKRFPLNLRPLLLVPKGLNPVTLGLCIQAYAYLSQVWPERKQEFTEKTIALIHQLQQFIPQGYSGACWGYDFDWEARYAKKPAHQPTIVATGIVTNGLYECFRLTGNTTARDLCQSAAEFVLNDLNRSEENQTICFSYSPFDYQQVYNANMKGARMLAQAYAITGNEEYKTLAQQATRYVVNHQNNDGSWYYSNRETGKWIDNYHTGYVLDCLKAYAQLTNDQAVHPSLQKGFEFYRNHFITPEGIPACYHNRIWPVDCTAGGQTLLTLSEFGEITEAQKVAQWMVANMQSPKGFFYYRKYKSFTRKTSFMRWSNAWMLSGLARLLYALQDYKQ